ncbi:MAG: DUF4400 domain-containing protein [Burkholderiaceae bacterium]|nr:DUF4400 domain-containing protein [Aquabacterium sp.]NUP86858.1 DUF4400 domain-containing protein [Burkholderiaceae bacterium]
MPMYRAGPPSEAVQRARKVAIVLLLPVMMVAMGAASSVAMFHGQWRGDAGPLLEATRAALADFEPGGPLDHLSGLAAEATHAMDQLTTMAGGALRSATGARHDQPAGSAGADMGQKIGTLLKDMVPRATARDAQASPPDAAPPGDQPPQHATSPAQDVAGLAAQLAALRVVAIVGMLPLLLLAYGVGVADGHTERLIRRACAGREMATIYHASKHAMNGLLMLFALGYGAYPGAVDTTAVMLFMAAIVAVIARTQWAAYKKYS